MQNVTVILMQKTTDIEHQKCLKETINRKLWKAENMLMECMLGIFFETSRILTLQYNYPNVQVMCQL